MTNYKQHQLQHLQFHSSKNHSSQQIHLKTASNITRKQSIKMESLQPTHTIISVLFIRSVIMPNRTMLKHTTGLKKLQNMVTSKLTKKLEDIITKAMA